MGEGGVSSDLDNVLSTVVARHADVLGQEEDGEVGGLSGLLGEWVAFLAIDGGPKEGGKLSNGLGAVGSQPAFNQSVLLADKDGG